MRKALVTLASDFPHIVQLVEHTPMALWSLVRVQVWGQKDK